MSTLFEAALAGNVDELTKLLRARHKVDKVFKDTTVFGDRTVAIHDGTALLAAVGRGHIDAARFLIEQGADINRGDAHGYTSLTLAAVLGFADTLDMLIDKGADLNVRDRTGSTALHYAVTMQQLEAAERLVRAGADVNIADNYCKPVLHHAIEQWKFAAVKESREQQERLAKAINKSVAVIQAEKDERRLSLERLIDLLFEAGADLHGRGLVGVTPLHVAAEANDVEMARRLIERGADFNRLDDHGASPLVGAARNVEMTRFLLLSGADPNAGTPGSARPLHYAVDRQHQDVLVELLKAGADAGAKTGQGATPISMAAEKALGDFVQLMAKLGDQEQSPETTETLRDESLRRAAQEGDAKTAKKLLAEGADPNATAEDGRRPLVLAAKAGHAKVVELLIEAGVAVDTKDHYRKTALHEAAEQGHADVVALLLKAGADANAAGENGFDENDGWTPLIAACSKGHADAAALLLRARADANARMTNKLTPLLYAAASGKPKLVEQLLKAGAKRDGIAEYFLETLEFADRLKQPVYRKAVDQLAKRCGVKPLRHPQFKKGVMFDLARSPRTKAFVPEVIDELIRPIVAKGEQDEKQARKLMKDIALDRARERAIHAVIDECQDEFLDKGCLLVFCESLGGDMLILLPTTNSFAAVACMGPWPGGAPRILEFLEKLAADWKLQLRGCSHATIMLQFTGKIADRVALAKRLFRIGSHERGVIDNGNVRLTDTIKELAAGLSRKRPIVRLWWD